jgi:hypothetical protein
MEKSIWYSICYSVWRNISSRLKKNLFHHLTIPLIGGIGFEALIHGLVPEDNFIANAWGLFVFRLLTLILGIFLSWCVVMFFLVGQETKKKLNPLPLMDLEKRLDTAAGYYGISIIDLADWFEPGSQLYLAKLLKHKLEVGKFEHDRTLLFFSNRELKDTKVDLTDESHHAKCLAFMHREFGIPLSFLERKEIFKILKEGLAADERLKLGCYPRWTTWRPFTKFQRMPLHWLRRRIPQLDFGLVTPNDGEPSVLRVSMGEGQLRIEKELEGEEARPYIKLANLIKSRVYKSDRTLKRDYDFLYRLESSDNSQPPKDARLIRVEHLAKQHKAKFRIKRYTRFVDIAERSGDVSVREEFEGVTAFPAGAISERLERTLKSQSGYFCDPQIFEFEGAQIEWEWEQWISPNERRGFITFFPPVENESVRFVIQRKTHNAMHFNQRDRQDKFEEVYGYIENVHELYVLKVRFPKDNFPPRFRIDVEVAKDQHDIEEEKLARSRFARFTCDSTAVLVLAQPLPGYTYRIRWDLPKDDVEQLNLSRHRSLSGHQMLILREANKRLLSLASADAERSKNVLKHLVGLQYQIANATIGEYEIDDPEIEVSLHAYNDEEGKQGLVMVASNCKQIKNVVPIGRGTVGQAYKRRAIVSWFFTSDSNDSDFWDYGTGHLGIVSIPLFFPLQTNVGGRVCVLSIATSSPESGFLKVIDQLDDPTARAFTQLVNAWYAKFLAKAIGLPDLSKETLNRTQTL